MNLSNKENSQHQNVLEARKELRAIRVRFNLDKESITIQECELVLQYCLLIRQDLGKNISECKSELEIYAYKRLNFEKNIQDVIIDFKNN